MIRGFLGLLLIVSAVAALAQENSAAPRNGASPTGILNRPAGIGRATGSTISIGNLESGTHTCGD